MNTILSKYAAVLLPFFILVIGGSQTVFAHGLDWTTLVPYLILVAGAVASFIVPLLPDAKWQGILKVGISIVTTILTAVVPFLLPGGFDPSKSWQIIVLGILNGLSTWLGQYIRTAEEKKEKELNDLAEQAFTVQGVNGVPTPAPLAPASGASTDTAPPVTPAS